MNAQRMPFAALDPDAPMQAWSPPAQVEPAPRTTRDVAVCLTQYAFPPNEPWVQINNERRWLRCWAATPVKPMRELVNRLERTAGSLQARDCPESGDIEILGRVAGHAGLVPLALVAHGLTYAECVAALQELAR